MVRLVGDGRSSNGRTRAFGARCGGSNPPRPTKPLQLIRPMLKVGLTGGLASGKSFAAAEFERLGCQLLNADLIGRRILADDADARAEVVSAFGSCVLNSDGNIGRKSLAEIVFSDERSLERLNAIIHPRVFQRVDEFFVSVRSSHPDAVAMVEAAIMIESGSYRRYDRLVLASCPREMQIQRFVAREGGTEAEAESRIARQLPLAEKVPYADFIIDTGGTEERTLSQVREIHAELQTASRRPVPATTADR